MNRVTIIGNLGRDPEVRTTQSGIKIVSFSVADSRRWTDKSTGEKKQATEWFNITIMNEVLGSVAERELKKGSRVMVEGKQQTRKWTDKDGNERTAVDVVIGDYNGLLECISRSAPSSEAEYTPPARSTPKQPTPAKAAQTLSDIDDDEIPF